MDEALAQQIQTTSRATPALVALFDLCATALGPLRRSDLQALAPEILDDASTLETALETAAPFLSQIPYDQEPAYHFPDTQLADYYCAHIMTPDEQRACDQRFVAYGQRWFEQQQTPLPDYLRRFWVQHLTRAQEWELAIRVVTAMVPAGAGLSQPWAAARLRREGSYAGYLADLDLVWRYAEHQRDLPLVIRCALTRASIGSLALNPAPHALLVLLELGPEHQRWSLPAVLEYVRLMPRPETKIAALQLLLSQGYAIPEQHLLELIETLPDQRERELALRELAAFFTAHQQRAVYDRTTPALRALPNTGWKVIWYCRFAGALAHDLGTTLYAEALQLAQGLEDEEERVGALGALVETIPEALVPQLLATIQKIREPARRLTLLGELAPRLPAVSYHKLYSRAVAEAKQLPNLLDRLYIQALLALKLEPHTRHDVVAQVLAELEQVRTEFGRALLLAPLIPRLPRDATRTIDIVYQTVLRFQETQTQGILLLLLLPVLPDALREETCSLLLVTFEREERWNQNHITTILPFLPDHLRPTGLALLKSLVDQDELTKLWPIRDSLTEPMRHHLYEHALRDVMRVERPWDRMETLCAFAALMTPAYRIAVHDQLLQRLTERPWWMPWTMVVRQVAPHLTPTQGSQMLKLIRSYPNEKGSYEMLELLAPYLMPALRDEALEIANLLRNSTWRLKAIQALSAQLPVEEDNGYWVDMIEQTASLPFEDELKKQIHQLLKELPDQSFDQAVDRLAEIHGAYETVKLLSIRAVGTPPQQRRRFCVAGLRIAETIPTAQERSDAIRKIASSYDAQPPSTFPELEHLLDFQTKDLARARFLGLILDRLPLPLQEQTMTALRAHLEQGGKPAADLLQQLARCLPSRYLPELLPYCHFLIHHRPLWETLDSLAERIPERFVITTLDYIRLDASFNEPVFRTYSLLQFARRLPRTQALEIQHQALTLAHELENERAKEWLLRELVKQVSAEIAVTLSNTVATLADAELRTRLQVEVLQALPASEQAHVCRMILLQLEHAGSAYEQATIFRKLLPYLPAALEHELVATDTTGPARAEPSELGRLLAQTPRPPLAEQVETILTTHPSYRVLGEVIDLVPALIKWTLEAPAEREQQLALWLHCIRWFANSGRMDFLRLIAAFAPWQLALSNGATMAASFDAINDVTRHWS